jgi:hypothetical protein
VITRAVLLGAALAACTTNNYSDCPDGGHGSGSADARPDARPDGPPDAAPDAAPDANLCGDGTCQAFEDATSCPADCTGTLAVENDSTYTVYHLYLYDCQGNTDGVDQLGANVLSPANTFDLVEPLGCYQMVAQTQTSAESWTSPPYTLATGGQLITWQLFD